MVQIKEVIEEKLNTLELEEAGKLIDLYQQQAPADMDVLIYKSIYHLYMGEIDEALEYAQIAARRYPTNGDIYYNLACIHEQKGEILEACKNFSKALYIYFYTKNEKSDSLGIKEKIDDMVKKYICHCSDTLTDKQGEEALLKCEEMLKCYFGVGVDIYRNKEKLVIGKKCWVTEKEQRYIGRYDRVCDFFVEETDWNLINLKGEFLEVEEGQSYTVGNEAEEYLLPIATEENNTMHIFKDKAMVNIWQRWSRHFEYYRVKANTQVTSTKKSFYGKEVPLRVDSKKKKLVLNIFVDGLSQEILNGQEFEKRMPNTYRFFKKGMRCTEAYSAAEWTYPSIVNYVTGLYTKNHMLFHNHIDGCIPQEVPTLAEYFQAEGYYTAMLSGDWRIIPHYGHTRGYQKFIYQIQSMGMQADSVIGKVIEHIEAFQETNQFLWMTIGDLHDIADSFELPLAVQSKMSVQNRKLELQGATSAKQSYNEDKIKAYKKMVSYIDILLNALYQYLEAKFKDEEIIISLFADHGQAYLVPEEGAFLSKERAKVAFMFRGGCSAQISDEIMSTTDYIKIMCCMAGIPMKDIEIDGDLPKCFGGQEEREYAFSESLHPKDPYYATFFAKDYTVYFENGAPTGDDGRFKLEDVKWSIKNKLGEEIENEELLEKYQNILFEHIKPLIIY